MCVHVCFVCGSMKKTTNKGFSLKTVKDLCTDVISGLHRGVSFQESTMLGKVTNAKIEVKYKIENQNKNNENSIRLER